MRVSDPVDDDPWRLARQGATAKAERRCEAMLQAHGEQSALWFLLGSLQAARGSFSLALSSLLQAVSLDPADAQIQLNLAKVYHRLQHADDAREHLQQAVQLDPVLREAHARLGMLAMEAGQFVDAIPHYQRVLELAPRAPGALNNLGVCCQQLEQYAQAVHWFRQALLADPQQVDSRHNLALCLLHQGEVVAALEHLDRAVRLRPDDAAIQLSYGRALQEAGMARQAITAYEQALASHLPRDQLRQQVLCALAWLCFMLSDMVRAERYCCQAEQEAGQDDIEVTALRLNMMQHQGQNDAAWQQVETLLERQPQQPLWLAQWATLAKGRLSDDAIVERLDAALQQPGLPDDEAGVLAFSLGDACDRAEHYPQALQAYHQGNKLCAGYYDMAEHSQLINRLQHVFSAANMSGMPVADPVAGPQPLFIVGMPRSGTSLLEQILGMHAAIHPGGELLMLQTQTDRLPGLLGGGAFPECMARIRKDVVVGMADEYLSALRAIHPAGRYITDKMPHNFLRLGWIQLLFPHACVIHCSRDPRDSCLSGYFQNFSSGHHYANDLAMLAKHYGLYYQLMQHWQGVLRLPMTELRYEDLVTDPEPTIRRVLNFCGLDWDPACLRFHESRRMVITASNDQVRQPLYQRSRQRWRHYPAATAVLEPVLSGYGVPLG